jgi:hypothetical protein
MLLISSTKIYERYSRTPEKKREFRPYLKNMYFFIRHRVMPEMLFEREGTIIP